jgi:hypothetical protein
MSVAHPVHVIPATLNVLLIIGFSGCCSCWSASRYTRCLGE